MVIATCGTLLFSIVGCSTNKTEETTIEETTVVETEETEETTEETTTVEETTVEETTIEETEETEVAIDVEAALAELQSDRDSFSTHISDIDDVETAVSGFYTLSSITPQILTTEIVFNTYSDIENYISDNYEDIFVWDTTVDEEGNTVYVGENDNYTTSYYVSSNGVLVTETLFNE